MKRVYEAAFALGGRTHTVRVSANTRASARVQARQKLRLGLSLPIGDVPEPWALVFVPVSRR